MFYDVPASLLHCASLLRLLTSLLTCAAQGGACSGHLDQRALRPTGHIHKRLPAAGTPASFRVRTAGTHVGNWDV